MMQLELTSLKPFCRSFLWNKSTEPKKSKLKKLYSSRTRHSLARVISTIAKILIPISQWPELLPFLSQCCISENAGHREIGVYVLYTLFETLADTLQDAFEPMLDQLFDLFSKLIHDPDSYIVRITTLQ